ncbi:MAG: outer membrane beta-barrel protein [Hyphomonadaceae bacterium]|nr:outer membrane beta-barrel protein [Hyphomonadaceae bacterium]
MAAHPALIAFAAAMMAFVPTSSFAQDVNEASVAERTRADYDPLGVNLGAFMLHGSLNFSAAMTDNVYADASGAEQEDTIFTVAPEARLSSNWSRHSLNVQGGAAFRRFQDLGSEDADTNYLRGQGRLDIGARSALLASVGVANEVEPRTDPDSTSTLEPVEYQITNASLSARHSFNRYRITGEVGRVEWDFDSAAQSVRDNEQQFGRLRLDAEITPRIGAFVQATADEREYPNSTTLDSTGETVLVGATLRLTDLLVGELAVGQFNREYDNSDFNTEGLAVAANLQWFATRLTTVTFTAERKAEDVVGGNSATPFVETRGGVRLDHELRRNIILFGGLSAGQREFSDLDRNDDFTSAEAGAEYLLNRRVALRARYRFDTVDSSGASAYRDFDVNTFSVGLSLRL